jgi:hypothetical protein
MESSTSTSLPLGVGFVPPRDDDRTRIETLQEFHQGLFNNLLVQCENLVSRVQDYNRDLESDPADLFAKNMRRFFVHAGKKKMMIIRREYQILQEFEQEDLLK